MPQNREGRADRDGVQASSAPFWSVIPAGGAGTRLWPLSRVAKPKFLLPLVGERSLLQETADRLSPLAPAERTIVVCGAAHAAAIARQLPELPESNLVIEPMPKGSGPAIALATAIVGLHDPEAIVGSFASDHYVEDQDAFVRAARTAIAAAETDFLVTIGLTPTRPETGYGYIERTDDVLVRLETGTAFRAASFVEKPDLARAMQYLESGRYLWNASMFVWRARALLAELERLQPELYAGILRIAEAWGTEAQEAELARTWPTLPESTIDQGVMEQARAVAVVPAAMGWSDVGEWHGLGTLLRRDDHGNSLRGNAVQIGATNCVSWSGTDRLIALVGVDNIVVVDTQDALLVVDRNRSQDVRQLVRALQAAEQSKLL
jgi:mannose-1-phosphate guanylyltransferase